MATLTRPEAKPKSAADSRALSRATASARAPIDWNASVQLYDDDHERAVNYIADVLLAEHSRRLELAAILSLGENDPSPAQQDARFRRTINAWWQDATFQTQIKRHKKNRPDQGYLDFIINDDIAVLQKELQRRLDQGDFDDDRSLPLRPSLDRDQSPGLATASASSGAYGGNGNDGGGRNRGGNAGQDDADPSYPGTAKKTTRKQTHNHAPPAESSRRADLLEQRIQHVIDTALTTLDWAESEKPRAGFNKPAAVARELKVHLEWDLFNYAEKEMHPGQTLGDMLVVIGEPKTAWITQCRDYVRWLDLTIGPKLLEGIEKCLVQHRSGKKRRSVFVSFENNYSVTLNPNPDGVDAYIWSPDHGFAKVVQALAWFTASFRLMPTDTDLKSDVFLSEIACNPTRDIGEIKLILQPHEVLPEDICWTSLYRGFYTAQFPVPGRWNEEDTGAEMSFEQIAAMAGVQYPVFLDQVMVFRGFRSVLYPTSVSTYPADPGRKYIQWHVVTSDKFDDDIIEEALASVKNISGENFAEVDELQFAIQAELAVHYLGYSNKATVRLGTAVYSWQDPYQPCGSVVERSTVFFQKKVVLNFGTSGLGIFGGGGAVEVGWTKSLKSKLEPGSDLDLELAWSAERFLLLYDVAKSTAWLVPELSVVLHLALSWIADRKDLNAYELEKLPVAFLQAHGGNAALDCIMKNHKLEFKREWKGKSWKFIEVIRMFLRFVKACRDTKDEAQAVQARAWYKMGLDSPRIYGWDAADLVAGEQTAYRQEVKITTNKKDMWITQLAHHPKMLTLFAANIAAPIGLEKPDERCFRWDPVPEGANWLASTSICLQQLMRSFGGSIRTNQLSSKKCYLRPIERHRPFDPCNDSRRCCRLHELTPEPPGKGWILPLDGAVLLGTSAKRSEPCKAKPTDSGPIVADKEWEARGVCRYLLRKRSAADGGLEDEDDDFEIGYIKTPYHPRSKTTAARQAAGGRPPSPNIKPAELSGSTLRVPDSPSEGPVPENGRGSLSPQAARPSGSPSRGSKTGPGSHRSSVASERSRSAGSNPAEASPGMSTADKKRRRSGQQKPPGADFEQDCRSLVLALAQRPQVDPGSIDLDQLVEEGKKLHAQLQRQRSLLLAINSQVSEWTREAGDHNETAKTPPARNSTVEETLNDELSTMYM